ncbi:MAG: hypothetical protein AAF548_01550 [Actinomycetota bacterium]
MEMVDPQPSDWRRVLSRGRRDRRLRSLLVAVASGVILITLIAATNSVVGAARAISSDARSLSETDESIRAATVARTLVVLAAIAVEDGEPSPDMAEVETALDILAANAPLATRDFSLAVSSLADNLATAGTDDQVGVAPDPALVAQVENQFVTSFDALVAERDALAAALGDSEGRLDDISTLAGLALLFVVPTLSIAVYRAVTRPDLDHAAAAHAADIRTRRDGRRRAAIAESLAALRTTLGLGASPLVVEQQLREMSAMAGVGVDGAIRSREHIDLRTALVSAVNRVELDGSIPIAGDDGRVHADEAQLITMFAALIGSASVARDRRIDIHREGGHLVAVISAIGTWPVEESLGTAATWDAPVDSLASRRLIAARTLASDLDATITPVNLDGRPGVRVALDVIDPTLTPRSTEWELATR